METVIRRSPAHFWKIFTRQRPPTRRSILAGLTVLASGLGMSPLHADVASGSSSGTPLTLNVTSTASLTAAVIPVTATTSILSTPLSAASGSAPGTYSVSGGPIDFTSPTANVNLNASTGTLDVNAGVDTVGITASVLTNSAASNVDGAPGLKTTTATAGVTGLDLGFGVVSATIDPLVGDTTLVNSTALSITTGVITSTSGVSGPGDGSAFDGSFSSSVANFNISIFDVSILSLAPATLVADLNAGVPVDVTINLEDVSIILPAGLTDLAASGFIQISNAGTATDGILSGSASATALTISLQGISISANIGGLITVETNVSGIVTAANTSAIQAVPEPSTILLLTGSLAGLLVFVRRRGDRRA